MRCCKCHKFGQGREKCRRQEPIFVECGKVGHAADSCKNDHHCVNSRGDHVASDKVCPKYAEEQAILRYRAYNGGTFQQARAAVVLEVAKEGKAMATFWTLVSLQTPDGVPPEQIWNKDESRFQSEHNQIKVVCKKGTKALGSRVSSNRENVTVIGCASDAGAVLSHVFIVKGKTRLPQSVVECIEPISDDLSDEKLLKKCLH
ncbi:nucleic-acid-binding protein from mobile element jockey [Elysia marginata]|uniref:Nucleic-acid-binding protein from mobile element jockey n=1 Tax=Elysia marginata TaxID=1093978 RepID=A0AAV4EF37_9GAST|nr:nucleic-acid-binding protein from mobile element jockey [Elysia marginata]